MYIQLHYKFKVLKKELEKIKNNFEYYRHEDHSAGLGIVFYSCKPTEFLNFRIKEISGLSSITGKFVLIKSIRRKTYYDVEFIKVGGVYGA